MRSAPPLQWLALPSLLALLLGCGGNPWGGTPTDDDDDIFDDDDDAVYTDSDGDGISDEDEGEGDADGDGIPNNLDGDSDNDGISDSTEAGDSDPGTPPVDSDGDGTPDFLDTDSDGNGVPDSSEGAGDSDGDGIPDSSDLDNDGDDIPDSVELGGDPSSPVDSDGDGTPDWLDEDSDDDGVPDWAEGAEDIDGDGVPSYLDNDSDGDGITDTDEAGADPSNPPDTDGDGFYNFLDADSDNDGIEDSDEPNYGTDPLERDSDGDGFTDLAEITAGTDPLDSSSGIDGYYAELTPRAPTTLEVPFTPEILMADVLFLLDTTCSMTDVLNNVKQNFNQVVASLSIPSVAYGVAEFDDYAVAPFGNSDFGDKPFQLRQQVTETTSVVQGSLNSLGIRHGDDWPESGMEALFQAATGLGYDQDCDNSFDWLNDVPPFIADSADAFGGSTAGIHQSALPGDRGGAGFRDGSVPVIVYATDAEIRDPDIGYPAPSGCSNPAGSSDVIDAVNELGGKLIGVAVSGNTPPGFSDPVLAMNNLANQTGSLADLDGNGLPEPLVYQNTSSSTVTNIMAGIEALSNSGTFDLSLVVDDSPHNFVQSIVPESYPDVVVGTEVVFEVTLFPSIAQTPSDQVFIFSMEVLGDGSAVLAEWELVLVVLAG